MGKIFLLRGYKGSGKDTLADYLQKEHGFGKLSFATKLKDEACRQYDVPRVAGDDQSLKEKALLEYPVMCLDKFSEHVNSFLFREFRNVNSLKPASFEIMLNGEMHGKDANGVDLGQLYQCPRSLFILEGSVKRSVNPNYWVDTVVKGLQQGKNYAVPDWRYRSEIAGLKQSLQKLGRDFGVFTVEIQRFARNEVSSTDPSELDLDGYKFDFTIDNRKSSGITLPMLYAQMEQILNYVTGGS